MAGAPKPVVIFDLDRTLTRGPTFSSYLWLAVRDQPEKVLFVFAVLLQMALYGLGLKTRTALKEYMLGAFLKGLSRREIEKLTARFLDTLFDKGFHGDGLKAIAGHREAGHRTGLATAAMDFYAAAIAKRLGLDFAITTTSVWERSCLVPMIKGENCYGPAKRQKVEAFLKETPHGAVWFYSDSHTDLPTFGLADVRVAVNPGLRLKRAATKNGFRIERWR